ncbi:MAG: T9SS type A sorting domain-containing protein [Winogradskyella sp.]|uniref:FG-GAP-like repeat-containing protein n=1 Tax=Winogradskyella sp. TaxID=1883156 RepID=UPI0017E0B8D2|nr:T9SS type A sorting domain-containing protein [Winogradskyella sp.]
MKKPILATICMALITISTRSQVINEPANWPNNSWSLTGSYDANFLDANPTISDGSSFFSFNDDNAGGSSINNVAAESPTINLTAAISSGETDIAVSFNYVFNIFQSEELKLQHWDADVNLWLDWGEGLTENSNAQDNFCSGSTTNFLSGLLDISTYTNNQLQNFRYRILYDDNASYGWGFCVGEPTLISAEPPACPTVTSLLTSGVTATSAQANWEQGASETVWEVTVLLSTEDPPTSGTSTSDLGFTFSGLSQQTNYTIYVRANCLTDGFSNWETIDFTTGEDLSGYPVTFTPNPINTSEDYDIALVDLNGDHLDDVVSVGSTTINVHYQLASGGFNEVDITTTPADDLPSWSLAAGDFDKNGYNDLLYGSSSGVTFMKANATGTGYTEISDGEYVFSQRSNFVDINTDGNLDAFVCHDVEANVYYINDGMGNLTFYQGQSPGVVPNGLGLTPGGGNYGTVWIDFDNDRDMDLFISKCRGGSTTISTNELWRNDGNGVFINVADSNNWYATNYPGVGHNNSSNLGDNVQTWSSAWADFDNDGYMDVYVGASSTGNGDSKLMRNNGDGSFSDVTLGSGVLDANLGIENVPVDFDNDGYIDILSNGNVLFNNGDFTFTNFATNVPPSGAIGDANNDGFLDVFRNGQIYINNTNSNNWIKINTVGNISNSNGIGARVEINTGTSTQIRDVRSGEGFEFMSSLNTHFGIGTATSIDNVTIYWPSGIVDYIPNPAINTTHTIVEGSFLSDEDELLNDLLLYPNPAVDLLTISPSARVINNIVTIFDSNGKRIMSHKMETNSLNVSDLEAGMYFLRLQSNGNSRIWKVFKK